MAVLTKAEEASILRDAQVSAYDINMIFSWRPDSLIDSGFKSMFHSNEDDTNGDGKKEFSIDFNEPLTIISAFIENYIDTLNFATTLGPSQLYAGTDDTPISMSLTKCTNDIFDSGFYISTVPSCSGTRFKIMRAERRFYTGGPDERYIINELRLYQTPNLLQVIDDINITAPPPKATKWAATNLIRNLGSRTSGNEASNGRPYISKGQMTN